MLPIAWSVDGQRGVRDPRAMFGKTLGARAAGGPHGTRAPSTPSATASSAPTCEFEGVVAAPFASALAALEEDEMDLGCVCIDMGGGSTSAAVFPAARWCTSTACRSAAAT